MLRFVPDQLPRVPTLSGLCYWGIVSCQINLNVTDTFREMIFEIPLLTLLITTPKILSS